MQTNFFLCFHLVGTEGVKVTFDIASNNYARKVTVENERLILQFLVQIQMHWRSWRFQTG